MESLGADSINSPRVVLWIVFLEGGGDESCEHRLGAKRPGSETGMGLCADEVRMLRQFEDLHNGLSRGFTRKDEASFFERFYIARGNFIAMAETHPD